MTNPSRSPCTAEDSVQYTDGMLDILVAMAELKLNHARILPGVREIKAGCIDQAVFQQRAELQSSIERYFDTLSVRFLGNSEPIQLGAAGYDQRSLRIPSLSLRTSGL
jgi:hypothetical protein